MNNKNQASRGIPRKSSRPSKKAKHQRYLAKSSCAICHLVFRTPRYKKGHADSKHQILIGVNRKRSAQV